MEIIIGVAGEAQRRETGFGGIDPQLLVKLADQRRLGRLAGLDLAARKFPQAGHLLALRTACQQHPPVGIDQRHRADQHNRACIIRRWHRFSCGSRH